MRARRCINERRVAARTTEEKRSMAQRKNLDPTGHRDPPIFSSRKARRASNRRRVETRKRDKVAGKRSWQEDAIAARDELEVQAGERP